MSLSWEEQPPAEQRSAIRDRLERFREWRDAVGDEIRQLPETLGQFRQGVLNFSAVSERITVEAVTVELEQLPRTLAQLRAGVANFNAISERLAVATEGFERMTRYADASGVTEVVRRLDDAVGIVTRQVAMARDTAPASIELVQSSVNELTRVLGRLTDLVPGARNPRRAPARTAKATKATKATKAAKPTKKRPR